jgi:hypothetical protein
MSITYDQAVNTLCGMFENWDRDTIIAIFQSNNYHVERTIEMILQMEQPGSNDTQTNSAPNSSSTVSAGNNNRY